MKLKRTKEPGEFTRRLIGYAKQGGALAECPEHTGSVFRTGKGLEETSALIKKAWQTGRISSDYDSAKAQMETVIARAPEKCSHVSCWKNGT